MVGKDREVSRFSLSEETDFNSKHIYASGPVSVCNGTDP